MQSVYPNRINWEDKPSINTPLGAKNLNKLDYAVYELDKRVLSLGGYETRVAESEKNAKASETNAKQSELLAKDYADRAFSGTPEGYAEIVDKVEKMDIKTTTDTTLVGSKEGGYKLLSMSGKSVQKTFSGKNLWSLGDISFTRNQSYSVDLPAGTYTLSAIASSSDTDDTKLLVRVYDEESDQKSLLLNRNVRNSGTFTLTSRIATVQFSASSSNSLADGDTATFTNIQLEQGEVMTDYEPYCGGVPSPNPNYPQSINNVGDCVEMINGSYSASTGVFNSSSNWMCNKRPIKCASGDVLSFAFENTFDTIYVIYYNNGEFLSSANITTTKSATVPSGATHFNFEVKKENVTIDTVGKISLTINGKSVVQFVELGKDECAEAQRLDGYLDSNGVATAFDGWFHSIIEIDNAYEYRASNGALGSSPKHCWFDGNMTFISSVSTFNDESLLYPPTNAKYVGVSYTRTKRLVLQKEKVATVLLDAPLRETDVMGNKEVVRKRAIYKASQLTWALASDGLFWVGGLNGKMLCSHFTYIEDKNITANSSAKNLIASGQCASRQGTTRDRIYFKYDATPTLEEWNVWIAENDFTIEIELATPIVETLDSTSQIALNSLETFDTVTYINVDSRTLPSEVKGEYGTSKVGARTIKNELRNDTLEIKLNQLMASEVTE